MMGRHAKPCRGTSHRLAAQHGRAGRSLSAWVKRFLVSYLPQHRGASPHTVTSYGQALMNLLDFLANRGRKRRKPTFRDLTVDNVLAFLSELESKRGNIPSTRNARLAAILAFLRFSFLMKGIDKDQYDRLRHIAFKRESIRPASCLEVAELEAIYRAVDHRTRDGFRDLTILKLLYNTGARASEVASIKIKDLDLDQLHVAITGKGHKHRLCGLWKTTAALIRIYLASERRTPRGGYEEYLFISQRRRPFTRFGIHDIVRRYVRKAAESCLSLAKKKVTPHTFRHTTCVHLVEAGVDLNTIRAWLGHEHLSTTETYANANLRMKRCALARLEQLDRKLVEEIAAKRSAPEVDAGIRRWLDSLAD